MPRFTRPIDNSSAVMGREGHLVCHVENADPKEYKVIEKTECFPYSYIRMTPIADAEE